MQNFYAVGHKGSVLACPQFFYQVTVPVCSRTLEQTNVQDTSLALISFFANWRDLDLYLTKYFQMMILAI